MIVDKKIFCRRNNSLQVNIASHREPCNVFSKCVTAYYKTWACPIGLAWPQSWPCPNFGLKIGPKQFFPWLQKLA